MDTDPTSSKAVVSIPWGSHTSFIEASPNMGDEPPLELGPQDAAGLLSPAPRSCPVPPELTGMCTVQ